ncbi:MAG: SOS response-associated peptidase [Sinobacteraceae bacterium]|nr:SOS response-associated peptidase [Nevskiaceae bacterium]
MCANFEPAPKADFRLHFDAPEPGFGYAEVYPGGTAPLIIASERGRMTVPAIFGLLPSFAKDMGFARRTFNARAETVAEKPSYRQAWARHQFGIAPVQAFYESCWETGKAVRWRIQRQDGEPFGLACIWSLWQQERVARYSLSLLTVNADGHPLMTRFHRPGKEKRSVVVVSPDKLEGWLTGKTDTRVQLRPFDARAFTAEVAAVPSFRGPCR